METYGFLIDESYTQQNLLPVNMRFFDYDFDQTSGYPSDSVATNLSKTTTSKELISIDGVTKNTAKMNNLNLMFGPINSPRYCREILNAPTFDDLLDDCEILLRNGEY